jgi:hypothetical protein
MTSTEIPVADGLTWEDSMRQWNVIASSILIHKSYLPVPNIIYDAVMAVIPQGDLAVFMYLYRRVLGYTSEDEVPQAVVPYEHFTNGRKTKEGRPIDFGCGLAVAATQESLARLRDAKMVVMVKRGKGGRLGSPDGPQGSTWTIGEGKEWSFAPFYDVMTYGQLGRYTSAARWGKLCPPRNAKEATRLEQAIKNRRVSAAKAPEIYIPEEWYIAGNVSPIVSGSDKDKNPVVSQRDNSIVSESDNSIVSESDNRVGTFSALGREKNTPFKDTNRKTLIKDTSSISQNSSATNSRETVGKGVKPSYDGIPPKPWQEQFIIHCYGSLDNEPGNWVEQVKSLNLMRVKYPLAVVLQYYDYKKAQRGMEERTLTPRIISTEIVSWSGLKQAMRDWEKEKERGNVGTTVVEGRIGERIGEGGMGTAPQSPAFKVSGIDRTALQERLNRLARGEVQKVS